MAPLAPTNRLDPLILISASGLPSEAVGDGFIDPSGDSGNSDSATAPTFTFAAILAPLLPPSPESQSPSVVIESEGFSAPILMVTTDALGSENTGLPGIVHRDIPAPHPPSFPTITISPAAMTKPPEKQEATAPARRSENPMQGDGEQTVAIIPMVAPVTLTSADEGGEGTAEMRTTVVELHRSHRPTPVAMDSLGEPSDNPFSVIRPRKDSGEDLTRVASVLPMEFSHDDHPDTMHGRIAARVPDLQMTSRSDVAPKEGFVGLSDNAPPLTSAHEPETPRISFLSAVRTQQGSEREVLLQLDPPSLGEVRIRLRESTEGIRGEIQVTRADVQALLESRLPELTRELHIRGLHAVSFLIVTSETGERASQVRARPGPTQVREALWFPPVRRVREINGTGRLDVRA